MAQQGFRLNRIRQVIFWAGLLGFPVMAQAQTAAIPEPTQEQIRQQQEQQSKDRARAIQEQQPIAPDVHLTPDTVAATISPLPIAETPNFPITRIQLIGESAEQFQFALKAALKQTQLHPIQPQTNQDPTNSSTYIVMDGQLKNEAGGMNIGVPLGAKGVNALMTAAQNAIIERGYTTTRILAEPQDLSKGTLTLTVIPGRVRHITVDGIVNLTWLQDGRAVEWGMNIKNPYHRHRFPSEIISHCVWLYYRFSLSYRDIELMMAERGLDLTYETIRYWCLKFGHLYAKQMRKRKVWGDTWHLDEVFCRINGQVHLCRNK